MSMPTRQQVYDFVRRNIGPDYYGDAVWADVYPPLVSSRNGGRKSQFCAGGVIHSEKQTHVPKDQWMAPGVPGALWVPTCRAESIKRGTWGDVSRISTAKLMDKLTFDWDDDRLSDHVGYFVALVDARRVKTIEWNTSKTGNGKDVGVWERVRYLSDIQGFIRSPYLDDAATKPSTGTSTPIVTVSSFDGYLGPNTKRGWQRYYVAQGRLKASQVDGEFWSPSPAVREIQRDLIRIGLLPKGEDDGVLGPKTWAALQRRFKASTRKAAVQQLQFDLWSGGFLR